MTQTDPKTPRVDQFQGDREAFQVASADTMNSPKRTKRIVGASQRRAEIVIATLFLVTAAASIPAAFVLDPILNAPAYLRSGKDSRQMGQSNLIDESSSAGKEQLVCQRLSQPNA